MIAFDWSGTGIDVFDGEKSYRLPSIDALLDTLTEPTMLVCESTFESYLPQNRTRILDRIQSSGHELYTFRPIHTAKYRKANGIQKSDANDARVIYSIASGNFALSRPRIATVRWKDFVKSVNREQMIDRFMGIGPELVNEFKDAMGELDETQRIVFLTKAGEYRIWLCAAIVRASRHAKSRREFEGLLGMHANAYPSQLRSDIVHWGYGFGSGMRNGTPRVPWSVMRREIRRAFHIMQGQGIASSR